MEVRRLILGAAHSYQTYVQDPTLTAPPTAFCDEHGRPPAQRFYNLLCLAYGADPVLFADAVEIKRLPSERARLCRRQYGELNYALTSSSSHLDQQLAKQVMDKSCLPADDLPGMLRKRNDVAATAEWFSFEYQPPTDWACSSHKTHREFFGGAEHAASGEAPWRFATLAGITALVALVSEVFVESVQ